MSYFSRMSFSFKLEILSYRCNFEDSVEIRELRHKEYERKRYFQIDVDRSGGRYIGAGGSGLLGGRERAGEKA